MRSYVMPVHNLRVRSRVPVLCVEPELMPLSFEAIIFENLYKREIYILKGTTSEKLLA